MPKFRFGLIKMSISVLHCFFAVSLGLLVCFEDGVNCDVLVAVLVDNKDIDRRVVGEAIRLKTKELNDTFQRANIYVQFFTADGTEAGAIKQYFDANSHYKPHLIIALDRYYGRLMLAHLCFASNTLLLSAAGGSDQFLFQYTDFATFVTPAVGIDASMSLVKTVMDAYRWTRTFIIAATDRFNQVQGNHLAAYLDGLYDDKEDRRLRVRSYLYPYNADDAKYRKLSASALLQLAYNYATR